MNCMKNWNLLFFLCLCFFSSQAQNGLYSLDAVPESLKTKAAVITHLENINFNVEGLEKATLSAKKIFTVLNEEGKDALVFHEYSTKFISLDDAEIKVYDKNGKQV